MGKKEPDKTLVVIGTIVAPRGLKGEFWVRPLTDDIDRFFDLKELYLLHPPEEPRQYRIQNVLRATRPGSKGARGKEQQVILALEELTDRTAAEKLIGCSLAVPAGETVKPAPGTYFIHQIMGLGVEDEAGRSLGEVVDVFSTGAHDIYVVRLGGREWYLPAIKEIIRRVDLDLSKLIVAPPPGLLELNE